MRPLAVFGLIALAAAGGFYITHRSMQEHREDAAPPVADLKRIYDRQTGVVCYILKPNYAMSCVPLRPISADGTSHDKLHLLSLETL